ncbi:hypothetical protein KP509_33G057100 [Ceratopteris richardii]|nr:hypothetical protein KP509_33G057100 [Ceratopteris richardii]
MSSNNGGRSFTEEFHVDCQPSAARAPDEGVLPQWGRGKRSRCSRPDASNKHAHTHYPLRESCALPPLQKSVPHAVPSAKLRSQGASKLTSTKFNSSERPLSRNCLINKTVSGSGPTNVFEPVRQTLESKERLLPQQKRSTDHGSSRLQQKSEGSETATVNHGNGMCIENFSIVHHANGTAVVSDGLEFNNKGKFEWPRITLVLTRKEKEEDFLVFKGAKLPQRPKKRLKVVEKALLFCTPGNWLGDISRGRYDVREKKSTKKKPRGLKAMDSGESDSD